MNEYASGLERWLPVIRYEDLYEVSDLGRVRSLDRETPVMMPYGPTTRHYRGKLLKPTLNSHGYPEVGLWKCGVSDNRLVHQLVLEAFRGPCPPGEEARHGPAGKLDASLANLCYGTRAENVGADRLRDGQDNRGERHGQAVTTREIVLEIRERAAAGARQCDLAAEYGLDYKNVWAIVHRKSWNWI